MLRKKKHKEDVLLGQEPINTLIGQDITLKGDLNGTSTIRIDGNIEGNLHIEEGIIIGEHAKITGDVHTDKLIVYGQLIGNTYCNNIQIRQSGILKGDIYTHIIHIESGGRYNGQLHMKDENGADVNV